ncbi:hypothetical protein P389DRAFT_58571 [Cystobasidium minutum MCA 4210]|uniref:uncharacterized protein n=1 Tax=Cystobasidium minutum MCA 4210 TaxID=1397322 RepID=UPI0034CEDD59|eukprot:jgi/Rhomi1/58571/CE58570_1292
MPPKASTSSSSASRKRKAGGVAAAAADHHHHNDPAVEGSPGPGAAGSAASTSTAAANITHQPYAPLKPPDGTALLRRDLQWDALEHIFTSPTPRFTPPNYAEADSNVSATPLFPTDRSWSFAELYLDCLANSSKANKNLKDKMSESTAFAVNFAKLCLLINVGRINTTLAFYPEMKTILRTYHSIPSMQLDDYSNKNLQDAPRMKAQLKGCHLPSDADNQPDSLAELIRRATVLQWKPPACVVTCIFLLFNEWTRISTKYFPEGFLLSDLFYPGDDVTNTIPSEQRSQAFLYLVHRFLETPELVASDFANGEAKLPSDQLLDLSRRDCSEENQDTSEEVGFAEKMQKFREDFIEKYKAEELANAAFTASAGGDEATPVPDDNRKGKANWLEKTSSQYTKHSRASSSTPSKPSPAKKGGRSGGASTHSDKDGILSSTAASMAGSSKLAAHVADINLAVPTIKAEPGLNVNIPPPSSVTSGIMTPTAVAPQLPASPGDFGISRSDYWRHALKKRKGEAAYAIAKLVPLEQGIAAPAVMYQWSQFCQVIPKRERSQLQLAWQKLKRDMDNNRDPVYESEDEPEWSPEELEPRLSGFLFRNHRTASKDVLRYQGNGPSCDDEQLERYMNIIMHGHDDLASRLTSPTAEERGAGTQLDASPGGSGSPPPPPHREPVENHTSPSVQIGQKIAPTDGSEGDTTMMQDDS